MPKGKVLVKDKFGNTLMVDKDDPRYLNGELVFFWKNRNHTEETKERKRKIYQERRYQDGEKNSQFGSCWITNNHTNRKINRKNMSAYKRNEDAFSLLGFKKGRVTPKKKVG